MPWVILFINYFNTITQTKVKICADPKPNIDILFGYETGVISLSPSSVAKTTGFINNVTYLALCSDCISEEN